MGGGKSGDGDEGREEVHMTVPIASTVIHHFPGIRRFQNRRFQFPVAFKSAFLGLP